MGVAIGRPDVRWAFGLHTANAVSGNYLTALHPLYTTNDPAIVPGQTIIEGTGLYAETYESTDHNKVGRLSPSVSGLEFVWNAYVAPYFLASLFQTGSLSQQTHTFTPRTTSMPTITSDDTASAPGGPDVLTVARLFKPTDSANENHYIAGAVVSSITISGDVGGLITASVDLVGFDHAYSESSINAPSAAMTTFGKGHALVDFDSSGDADLLLASQSLTARSFSITITNGAAATSWNSKSPQAIVFTPKLQVTGEVVVQLDAQTAGTIPAIQKVITDLEAGTDMLFEVKNYNSTVNAAGEWQILSNVLLTGDPEATEGESAYDLRIPFKGVHDGTNNSIQIAADNNLADWT